MIFKPFAMKLLFLFCICVGTTDQNEPMDIDPLNALNSSMFEVDEYLQQIILGELVDSHVDVGPLDELDGYDPDGMTKYWNTNIAKWKKKEKYACFQFNQADPANPLYRCQFCGES